MWHHWSFPFCCHSINTSSSLAKVHSQTIATQREKLQPRAQNKTQPTEHPAKCEQLTDTLEQQAVKSSAKSDGIQQHTKWCGDGSEWEDGGYGGEEVIIRANVEHMWCPFLCEPLFWRCPALCSVLEWKARGSGKESTFKKKNSEYLKEMSEFMCLTWFSFASLQHLSGQTQALSDTLEKTGDYMHRTSSTKTQTDRCIWVLVNYLRRAFICLPLLRYPNDAESHQLQCHSCHPFTRWVM